MHDVTGIQNPENIQRTGFKLSATREIHKVCILEMYAYAYYAYYILNVIYIMHINIVYIYILLNIILLFSFLYDMHITHDTIYIYAICIG